MGLRFCNFKTRVLHSNHGLRKFTCLLFLLKIPLPFMARKHEISFEAEHDRVGFETKGHLIFSIGTLKCYI